MRPVLVLGPSRWTQTRRRLRRTRPPSIGEGHRRVLTETTPVELRRALASTLIEHGIRALLFEDWQRRPGESHTRAFQRLVRVVRVGRFFVLWPRGASLLGLDWELGFLATRVESQQLDPRRIVLLLECGVVRLDLETGIASIGEPGNRTRYFEDLVTWRCPVSIWSTYEEMLERGLYRAMEELSSSPRA
jgi:hypothetical protein